MYPRPNSRRTVHCKANVAHTFSAFTAISQPTLQGHVKHNPQVLHQTPQE